MWCTAHTPVFWCKVCVHVPNCIQFDTWRKGWDWCKHSIRFGYRKQSAVGCWIYVLTVFVAEIASEESVPFVRAKIKQQPRNMFLRHSLHPVFCWQHYTFHTPWVAHNVVLLCRITLLLPQHPLPIPASTVLTVCQSSLQLWNSILESRWSGDRTIHDQIVLLSLSEPLTSTFT